HSRQSELRLHRRAGDDLRRRELSGDRDRLRLRVGVLGDGSGRDARCADARAVLARAAPHACAGRTRRRGRPRPARCCPARRGRALSRRTRLAVIIFSPGPSNISERVRRALLAPDICHRDSEFTELLRSVRERILRVAGVTSPAYETVVYTGSGSVAIESVAAATKVFGPMLVVSNGPYGERAAAMARYHGGDVHEWKLAWGEAIDTAKLDAELVRSGARTLYVVHHETATGRLNPLRAIAACGKARGCMVVTDAVSSIAG